jgi:hypothetical protein
MTRRELPLIGHVFGMVDGDNQMFDQKVVRFSRSPGDNSNVWTWTVALTRRHWRSSSAETAGGLHTEAVT